MTENFQSPEDAEIFEAAAERGAHTPLDDAPELDSEAQWYLKAFNLLSSGRPVGLTAGPLPLSDQIVNQVKLLVGIQHGQVLHQFPPVFITDVPAVIAGPVPVGHKISRTIGQSERLPASISSSVKLPRENKF